MRHDPRFDGPEYVFVEIRPTTYHVAELMAYKRVKAVGGVGGKFALRPGQTRTSVDLMGASGEAAFAQHYRCLDLLNISPKTREERRFGDVGRHEIKSTARAEYGLRVQKDDDPDHPYVLVHVVPGGAYLRGWLWGHEAKKKERWADWLPHPCYLSDPPYLRDIRTCPNPRTYLESWLKEFG